MTVVVDTALRTADSGYLTRRLVDVAQDVIIREVNCKTSKGILLETMLDNQKVLIDLKQSLLGRVLAEDILDTLSNKIIAYAGQGVDPNLADKIIRSNHQSILVRSPLTCDSIRSICQLCYGWNLAHEKMVDLGEAVGIIAAQSIGEPGTQLTMRTFHTGGVFTGELAQTIVSYKDAQVYYTSNIPMLQTRTRHGDKAMLINSDCKLKLIDNEGKESFLSLTKGTLLLVMDRSFVKAGDTIAEYPLSNRIITERAQKVVVSDFSGSIHLTDLNTKELQNKQSFVQSAVRDGILWLLSGVVHNVPDHAKLVVHQNQVISEDSLLARTKLISRYSGYVKILEKYHKGINQQILVITSSKIFSNVKIYQDDNDIYRNYILETKQGDKFVLKISPDQKIIHNQILGDLISDVYKTHTGGIIKYLDLTVSRKKTDNNNDYYDIFDSGYILWIPEETHEINKDISLLLVNHGDFVEIGTEIIKNVFANNSGVLEVIQKDGIIREIIIKPGKLYGVDSSDFSKHSGKCRGFLKPGENIVKNIFTDKLVYWEYIHTSKSKIILIRPVIVYSVPDKNFPSKYTEDSFGTDVFNISIVRRTCFRDGARVKSVHGVDLVKTHLIAKLSNEITNMKCTAEFIINSLDISSFLLKLTTADVLSLKDVNIAQDKNFYTRTHLKINDQQYINSGSVIAQTEILSRCAGKIESIKETKSSTRRILIISDMDTRVFHISNNQLVKVRVNDWVYAGDEIATNLRTLHSGKVTTIRDNQIIIRIGQPYLISKGSILHVNNGSLVKRSENIATLIFERSKTGDIVQGLPRIEEILEARKKSDNSFNPHFILESSFRENLNKGLSLHDATRLSLLETQLSLVKEVQLVYQSQGVDISDKHIEVIVRQMTSKVKIDNGGDTGFLPGEMIELQKIESVNKSLSLIHKEEASYHPILLGITKASLNTESFISAASFQETTKVLTDAAISGKLDWLRGLKENVIIGRLIPAGTGFNIYSNPLFYKDQLNYNKKTNFINKENMLDNNEKYDFEDIILDDRSKHMYPDLI